LAAAFRDDLLHRHVPAHGFSDDTAHDGITED
jgi:hypothetical protein